MDRFTKYAVGISAGITGLVATLGHAFGAIIDIPAYSDIVSTTSTTFAQNLITDMLPWIATFVGLIIAVMLVKALYGKLVGGAAKLLGRRRGRRGRRRR